MIVFVSFLILTILTVALRQARAALLERKAADWALDASGLLVQGIAVPALQASLVYAVCAVFIPEKKGALDLAPAWAFTLNFVAVDYLYYWNHRLLHSRWLWRTHAVHHTPARVDVFITSRNTLWAPLLIVYVWANGVLVFLLRDPAPFLLAASLTASLDLWRHTGFAPTAGSPLHRLLALALITPNEHTWHHSSERTDCNFGANLSLWDHLHGTYYSPATRPGSLGIALPLSPHRKLLFPF